MHEAAGRTTIFFPLRTNVEYFALPEGYLSLEARLKQACLLYDEVVVEAGMYMALIGPERNIDFWVPPHQLTENMLRDRWEPTGGEFVLVIGGHEMVSPAERRFKSEFHSILRTLPVEEPSWMSVSSFSLTSEAEDLSRRLAESILEGAESAMPDGSAFLKLKVTRNLTRDLVLSSAMGTAVSMDPLHSPVVRKVAPTLGGAPPGKGFVTLNVMVPNFANLPWEAVLEERDQPSVAAFREKVSAIEELARQGLTEGATEEDIRRETNQLLIQELAEELQSRYTTPRDVAEEVAVDMILSAGSLVLPGIDVGVKIAQGLAELYEEQRSWLASFLRLRRV